MSDLERRSILVILFMLAATLSVAAQSGIPAYNLTVTITPSTDSLAVVGTVEAPVPAHASSFAFDLHRTLDIKKLLVNGEPAHFEYGPMHSQTLPATRGVTVTLPTAVSSPRVHMEIEYEGRLDVLPEFGTSPDFRHSLDDQINPRLVELAGYSSWYPQFEFGQRLQLELTVSLPRGWTTICSGLNLASQTASGRLVAHCSSPDDIDLVIVASPNFRKKTIDAHGVRVEVYFTQLPASFVNRDAAQVADALKLFSAQLGQTTIPGSTVHHVFSPKKKGQGKAGFARPGLIVTSEGITMDELARNPNFSLFQGVAHEIAHYWWRFGVGQGDWINEAFAEYFSAVAMQRLVSDAQFQSILADYRKQVAGVPADAPPLSAVMPWTNFVVRYYKGALMLDALRESMGDKQFFDASREFYQAYKDKPTQTEDFRRFWKVKLGNKATLLDSWLESPGGVPSR